MEFFGVFFGNSLGILWEFGNSLEFLWNSLGLLGNSFGIILEFFGDVWLGGSECMGVDFG